MAPNMVKALSQYRYERKFFISELTFHEVESLIRLHPALFTEIYHQRYVNNIYYDSFDMKNYFDNVDGANQRIKVRIRWYGDLFGRIEKPILELKIKKGLLGTKKTFPLSAFWLDENFNFAISSNVITDSQLPDNLKLQMICLAPVLLNRYSRKYFLSADNNYRITIDSEMQFLALNNQHNCFLNCSTDLANTVLELKYDQDKDDSASYMADCFPFRLSKSSKYVSGIKKFIF